MSWLWLLFTWFHSPFDWVYSDMTVSQSRISFQCYHLLLLPQCAEKTAGSGTLRLETPLKCSTRCGCVLHLKIVCCLIVCYFTSNCRVFIKIHCIRLNFFLISKTGRIVALREGQRPVRWRGWMLYYQLLPLESFFTGLNSVSQGKVLKGHY